MATVGFVGRDFTVEWDGTIIKGVLQKGLEIAREGIDITSDDDAGHRTFLATPGVMSAEGKVSGITSDEDLIAAIFTGAPYTMPTAIWTMPTGGTITYTFFLASISITGETAGVFSFEATMQSSGAPTYTP